MEKNGYYRRISGEAYFKNGCPGKAFFKEMTLKLKHEE